MKRLITFGCSNTYGQALVNREQNVWGARVSQALDRKHINMGKPGASNKYIAYNIIDFDYRSDDLVFILWTFPERYTKLESKDKVYNFLPNYTNGQDDEPNEAYYAFIFSYFDCDFNNRAFMNYSLYFLKSKGIKFVNLFIKEEFHKYLDFQESIVKQDFKYFYHRYPKATDNLHLGEEGHLQFSKAIVGCLKENSYI